MIILSDIGSLVASIVVVTICIVLFVLTYLLNKNTKKPDGCETLNCEGCSLTECSNHPNKKEEQEKGE